MGQICSFKTSKFMEQISPLRFLKAKLCFPSLSVHMNAQSDLITERMIPIKT